MERLFHYFYFYLEQSFQYMYICFIKSQKQKLKAYNNENFSKQSSRNYRW